MSLGPAGKCSAQRSLSPIITRYSNLPLSNNISHYPIVRVASPKNEPCFFGNGQNGGKPCLNGLWHFLHAYKPKLRHLTFISFYLDIDDWLPNLSLCFLPLEKQQREAAFVSTYWLLLNNSSSFATRLKFPASKSEISLNLVWTLKTRNF